MIGKQILFHIGTYFFMVKFKVDRNSFLIPKSERYDYFTPQLILFRIRQHNQSGSV